MKKIAIILLVTLFTVDFISYEYFPEWTFVNPSLNMLLDALARLLFWLSIFLFIGTYITNQTAKLGVAIVFVIMTTLAILLVYHPIDTVKEPIDIQTIHSNNRDLNQKVVVQLIKNPKTGHTIFDTVLVEDKGIFRKKINKNR